MAVAASSAVYHPLEDHETSGFCPGRRVKLSCYMTAGQNQKAMHYFAPKAN